MWYPPSFVLPTPQIHHPYSILFLSILYYWSDLTPSNVRICLWSIGSSLGTICLGSWYGRWGNYYWMFHVWGWGNGGLVMMTSYFDLCAISWCIAILCLLWLSSSSRFPLCRWSHIRLLGMPHFRDMVLVCVLHTSLLGDTYVGDLVSCWGSTRATVHIPLSVEVSWEILVL